MCIEKERVKEDKRKETESNRDGGKSKAQYVLSDATIHN
jgi:hypothetical protein